MDIGLFGVLAMSWLVGIHDVYVCTDLKGLIFALKIVPFCLDFKVASCNIPHNLDVDSNKVLLKLPTP
jgi:hypothetical protein